MNNEWIMNRLKFPMLRPTGIRLQERVKRLMAERPLRQAEEEMRKDELRSTRKRTLATLIGQYIFCIFYLIQFRVSCLLALNSFYILFLIFGMIFYGRWFNFMQFLSFCWDFELVFIEFYSVFIDFIRF